MTSYSETGKTPEHTYLTNNADGGINAHVNVDPNKPDNITPVSASDKRFLTEHGFGHASLAAQGNTEHENPENDNLATEEGERLEEEADEAEKEENIEKGVLIGKLASLALKVIRFP